MPTAVTHELTRRSRYGVATAVRVLDADPDLANAIEPQERPLAVAAAIAPAFDLEPGPWRFFPPPDPGGLGALIVAGMILIRIDAGARAHVELLGEGDVISPWVDGEQDLAIPSVLTATVMSPVRVALLDRRFAFRTARWPGLHAALFQRLIMRARRLSLQAAINGVYRVEDRVELTLWELAHRFGRVTPEGLVVDLPMTHPLLADLMAAQRPTVSLAIARLEARGRAVRLDRHRWLLQHEPPAILSGLAGPAAEGAATNLRPVTKRGGERLGSVATGRAAAGR